MLREMEAVREQFVQREALPHLRKQAYGDSNQAFVWCLLHEIQGLLHVRGQLDRAGDKAMAEVTKTKAVMLLRELVNAISALSPNPPKEGVGLAS